MGGNKRDGERGDGSSSAAAGSTSPGADGGDALFDALPVGIAQVGPDGRLLRANRRLCELLGYRADELRGKPLLYLFDAGADGPAQSGVDSGARAKPALRRLRRKDGSCAWVEVDGAPAAPQPGAAPGEILAFHDVTERLRTDRALRESEQRLRFLAETMPSIVWMAAADGSITYVNQRWLRYCGIPADQAKGSWAELVVHPDDYERCMGEWAKALQEGLEYEAEVRHRRHDGVYRWFISRAVPLREASGRVSAWCGVTTDIDDQKRLEHQLLEADRRKDEFIAVLGHELRNPLAAICNAHQLLRQTGDAHPEPPRALEVIERQTQQLTQLVDDLLDVARIKRGLIELRPERVDLREVVAGAVEASRPLIEAKRHELHVELAPESLWVDGDVLRLTQVIVNLLNNAAKYTEAGGRIRVAAERAGEQLLVRVKDTGVGMGRELLEGAFDLFAQGDGSRAASEGGLGIGLTLVRRLVELHGGSVEAHSDGPGTGSEFTLRLCVAPALGRTDAPGEQESAQVARRDDGLRVLLVDDNADAGESLLVLLRLWNYEVCLARDGPEAIAVAGGFRPHVAVVDIGLPGMDGYEVAARLCALFGAERPELIALSGYAASDAVGRRRAAGFQHYLVKPADPSALRRILAACEKRSAG